ncbi:MAG: glycosyltransferase family 4 protein [Dehalococcoidia bacterium]
MRVLNVNKFHYRRGGAETVYFAQTELLARHGHDVIPFSMQHPENEATPYARYFVSNIELRDEDAGISANIAAAGRMLYSREAARKLDALIRATRPDVAHLHNIYHQLSPSVLRVLAKHRIPAVLTMHDYKLICPAYTLYANGAPCERCKGGAFFNATLQGCVKDSRAKSVLCTVEAYLHSALGLYRRNVACFIAPSRFLAGKAAEFGMDAAKITYLPNFIEPRDMPDIEPKRRIMYVGRLERVKGIRTLIDAFARSSAAESCELVIAGDGEDRAALERYAQEAGAPNVRFTGHLPQAGLMALLDESLFTVTPSEWYENAPLSVMEAAARGRAVIVSDLGGLPELVKHGETGLVFRAGDTPALAGAIDELAGDPPRARAMGVNARSFIEERFSAQRHYDQLIAIYQRALSREPQLVTSNQGVAT